MATDFSGNSYGLVIVKGFPVEPGNFSWGQADADTIQTNDRGQIIPLPVFRRTLSITLRGVPEPDVVNFDNESVANRRSLRLGTTPEGETLTIGGRTITRAVLFDVIPSSVNIIYGFPLVDLQLEFQSMTLSC